MTVLARSRVELAAAMAELGPGLSLVPTMGALHAGHDANIDAAKAAGGPVAVSVFVNPMQFDKAADLARYPRDVGADLQRCRELGVDLVWAPDVSDVYPAGPVSVSVSAGLLASELEGASRPGHFDGVLTVVAKLFGLFRPARAFFGEKDYQQLVLVRQLVADLELGVSVGGVETVREADGLALSSRNVFLAHDERVEARALSQAMRAAQSTDGAAAMVAAARQELAAASSFKLDYLQLRGTDLGAPPRSGPARLLVAGSFGATRLIDNCAVEIGCP